MEYDAERGSSSLVRFGQDDRGAAAAEGEFKPVVLGNEGNIAYFDNRPGFVFDRDGLLCVANIYLCQVSNI